MQASDQDVFLEQYALPVSSGAVPLEALMESTGAFRC